MTRHKAAKTVNRSFAVLLKGSKVLTSQQRKALAADWRAWQ